MTSDDVGDAGGGLECGDLDRMGDQAVLSPELAHFVVVVPFEVLLRGFGIPTERTGGGK